MVDFILVAVLLVIVGGAVLYIVKEKKKGVRCIGCPSAGKCANARRCSGESGCGSHEDGELPCHKK